MKLLHRTLNKILRHLSARGINKLDLEAGHDSFTSYYCY